MRCSLGRRKGGPHELLWRGTAWRPRICAALSPWAPGPTTRTGTPAGVWPPVVSGRAAAAGRGHGPTSCLRAQARPTPSSVPGGAGHGRCEAPLLSCRPPGQARDFGLQAPAGRAPEVVAARGSSTTKAWTRVRVEAWASGTCAPGLQDAALSCQWAKSVCRPSDPRHSRSVHSGTPNLLPNRDLVKNSRTVCDAVCNKALAQSTYSLRYGCNSNFHSGCTQTQVTFITVLHSGFSGLLKFVLNPRFPSSYPEGS